MSKIINGIKEMKGKITISGMMIMIEMIRMKKSRFISWIPLHIIT
jgi:hypothetical protein